MKTAALALAAAMLSVHPAAAQMREYPVRTPAPANAVAVSAGTQPPEGMVALEANMPGHRRFKPPLFPDAGWDSPLRIDGRKDYDHYLVEYWRAPFLPHGDVDPAHAGQEQRGYIAPPPHAARIARSRASEAEDALLERRMQFITEQILASPALRDLHGASLEPELTIAGRAGPGAGDAQVMRGEIVLQLNIIAPHLGVTERMPDGAIRSAYAGPALRIKLNPEFINCAGPANRSAAGARCLGTDGFIWVNAGRNALSEVGAGPDFRLVLSEGLYADDRPATDLRAVFIQHDRVGRAAGDIARGRMHPHDPLGRVVGVMNLIDWNDLLRRAGEIQ